MNNKSLIFVVAIFYLFSVVIGADLLVSGPVSVQLKPGVVAERIDSNTAKIVTTSSRRVRKGNLLSERKELVGLVQKHMRRIDEIDQILVLLASDPNGPI